ncbi:Mitochondrial inner membrane protease ATP23 [Gryllus bimaculatus]|nr:Mitochondrial inner membrane protease ATP23 [Gryllus bimaculatus]
MVESQASGVPSNDTTPAKENLSSVGEDNYGYDLYPERKGEQYKPGWKKVLLGQAGYHIDKVKPSCEVNDGSTKKLWMVVICQNMVHSEGTVQGILTHEMIHMFDYCNNKLDFKNVDHLACTEIRAANLTHCSFLSAWAQGDASPFDVKKRHQECVKTKAVASVMAVRNISAKEACNAVERVFNRCYNDLEPIGRRIRRNSYDMQKAYMEAPLYGYE